MASLTSMVTSVLFLLVGFRLGETDKAVGESRPRAAVIGGSPAPDRPFYVNLDIDGGMCGGSIIHKRVVLTAAHCFGVSQNRATVIVGDFTRKYGTRKVYLSKSVIVHEGFNQRSMANDVALVIVSSSFPSHRIISLCKISYYGKRLVVSGMGRVIVYPKQLSDVLMEAVVVETRSNCIQSFDPEKMICVKKTSAGKSACKGDSGGPLFPISSSYKAICLYGVVSRGDTNCGGDTLYARASGYADWIQYKIGKYV